MEQVHLRALCVSVCVSSHRVQARKLSIAESAGDAFIPIINREKCDLLVLLTPSAKVTPVHVLDLLRTARTNLLIWRPKSEA